jgi:peptidoglycan hydrolase-like amidase
VKIKNALIITTFSSILILTSNLTVKSEDKCAKISDLDERAQCYKAQIDKKEDEYESTSKKLSDIQNKRNSINQKLGALSSQLNVTQAQVDDLAGEIKDVQKELASIQASIDDRRGKLDKKTLLRNKIVRNYVKLTLDSSVDMFLMDNGFEFASMSSAFSKAVSSETKKIIEGLNFEISNFEADKKQAEDIKGELESDFNDLTSLVNKLALEKSQKLNEEKNLAKEENTTKGKLANLSKEISELSSKQQEILDQKSGNSTGSVGDYESPRATVPQPDFGPAFAAFSYGAYTHYNGMSQFGAYGRSQKGQSYEDILNFYYKVGTSNIKKDTENKINVQGFGEMSYKTYLYGIAEMPSDWGDNKGMEALKAQAVAARSYANKASKPICTTESCQVFSICKSTGYKDLAKTKTDPACKKQFDASKNWRNAVDETSGKILNNPKTAQYSSTTGGYINNVGWDTKSGGKWPGDAYEKLAGSPWFYWAWFSQLPRFDSDKCGRKHPWLTEKEMADILNSYVVWNDGSSGDRDNISPVTKSCWGGDPYSLDEMKEKADKYGTGYSKVTSVDVDISNGGYTSKVTLGTDKGTVSIDGQTFKTVFNLRAPGYISIKSRLFDLEKRN